MAARAGRGPTRGAHQLTALCPTKTSKGRCSGKCRDKTGFRRAPPEPGSYLALMGMVLSLKNSWVTCVAYKDTAASVHRPGHRTMESQNVLEGTFKDHLVQSPCSERVV